MLPKVVFKFKDSGLIAFLLISKAALRSAIANKGTAEEFRRYLEGRYKSDFAIPVTVLIEDEDALYAEILKEVED